MNKDEQIDLLTLLAMNETTVLKLYKSYAEKTLIHEDFWQKFSGEETTLAEWIMELAEKAKEVKATVSERLISREDVQRSIFGIREEIDRVLNTGLSYLTHEEEFEIVFSKEDSLIEKKFFKVMKTDDKDLKKLLKNLKRELQNRFNRIEVELKAEKKRK
ncbi:MAG: hypothetical protein U9O20_02460 [Patescibacteria group bacterium]|nr:hypothetical protein [Patescibacteria group bacterium]